MYGRWFTKGQRVRMTKVAQRQLRLRRGGVTGVVVGKQHLKSIVSVLRDGLKTPSTYWSGFWRPE